MERIFDKSPSIVSNKEQININGPDLKISFVRHAKPEYTEEEERVAVFQGKLTPAGEQQADSLGQKLAAELNPEKEIIVFWISPKQRAQETAKKVKDILKNNGIPVREPKTFNSLSDTHMTPEFNEIIEADDSDKGWMKYWTTHEVPEGTETPEDVKKRLTRVLVNIEKTARNVKPEGNKKIHILCFGHEETIRDLLETGFGFGTEKGTGPNYTEVLDVDVYKSGSEKDAILKLNFREKEVELGLNVKTREFYKKIA